MWGTVLCRIIYLNSILGLYTVGARSIFPVAKNKCILVPDIGNYALGKNTAPFANHCYSLKWETNSKVWSSGVWAFPISEENVLCRDKTCWLGVWLSGSVRTWHTQGPRFNQSSALEEKKKKREGGRRGGEKKEEKKKTFSPSCWGTEGKASRCNRVCHCPFLPVTDSVTTHVTTQTVCSNKSYFC